MPVRDVASHRGVRRSLQVRSRIAAELEAARIAAGLSYRELDRRSGVDRERIARALRADPDALTVDLAARVAAVLGLQLGLGLYPDGDPVRDAGQLRLIGRFRTRLSASLRWRSEVAMPIAGDRRAADGVISGDGFQILVEAETRLGDVQAVERAIAGKQRDLGISRVILLVADTRHNRAAIAQVEELRARFPVDTRTALAALSGGRAPAGDALVIL